MNTLGSRRWSGWWDLNNRPVAAATALLMELIQKVPTFAGFEEALAPYCFSPSRECLVMQ
jgi:hypothetical protein